MDQEKEKNILDHLDDLRFFPRVRGPHLGSSGTKRTANHGPEGNMEGDEARYLASYNHSRDPQVMSVIFMDFSSLRS